MRSSDSADALDDHDRDRRVQEVFSELLRSHLKLSAEAAAQAETAERISNLEAALSAVRQSTATPAAAAPISPASGSFVYDFEAEARLHHGITIATVSPSAPAAPASAESPATPAKLNFLSPSPRNRVALTFSPASPSSPPVAAAVAAPTSSPGSSSPELMTAADSSLLAFLRNGAPKTAKITIVQPSTSPQTPERP